MNESQKDRYQRGLDFQEECRRSWKLLPHIWRLRITDGRGLGTRPADELILMENLNLLCEMKRTVGDVFTLSMLRTDQVKGLLQFEQVLERNRGLVFVSFNSDDLDTAYSFRLYDALRYMKKQGRRYITEAELRQEEIPAVDLPRISLDGEPGYDFRGLVNGNTIK